MPCNKEQRPQKAIEQSLNKKGTDMIDIPQRLKEISDISYGDPAAISHKHYEDYVLYEDEETLHHDVMEVTWQRDDGSYDFEWYDDEDNDIVYLGIEVYQCKKSINPICYYGYSFNWRNPKTQRVINKLTPFIENNEVDEDIIRLLDNTVDRLIDHLDIIKYDYIITMPCYDPINDYLSSTIKRCYDNIDILPITEIEVENMRIDWDEIRSHMKNTAEFEALKNSVLSHLEKNKGRSFDIEIIPGWCRRFVEPIIRIGNDIDNSKISKAKHILVFDNEIISDKSIGQALFLLNSAGYKGDYTFTLFRNC